MKWVPDFIKFEKQVIGMKKNYSITLLFLSMMVSHQLRAQKIFSKPQNPSEFAGRILGEQKSWQQLQLPKNSVQYKLNPPVSYTYNFGKKAEAFSYTIHLPEEKSTAVMPFYISGNHVSHPYLKYYPPYKGKLHFNKQLIPGQRL